MVHNLIVFNLSPAFCQMWDSLDTLCHGKAGTKLFGHPEQKKTDTGSLIHIGKRDGLPIFCYGPSLQTRTRII